MICSYVIVYSIKKLSIILFQKRGGDYKRKVLDVSLRKDWIKKDLREDDSNVDWIVLDYSQ